MYSLAKPPFMTPVTITFSFFKVELSAVNKKICLKNAVKNSRH